MTARLAGSLGFVLLAEAVSGQGVGELLATLDLALRNSDGASANAALKAMLAYEDPRVAAAFYRCLLNGETSNQAKWCLIRTGKRSFPTGWALIQSEPKRFAPAAFDVWMQCGPGGIREVQKGMDSAVASVRIDCLRTLARWGARFGPEPELAERGKTKLLAMARAGSLEEQVAAYEHASLAPAKPMLELAEEKWLASAPALKKAILKAAWYWSHFDRSQRIADLLLKGLADRTREVRLSAVRPASSLLLLANPEVFTSLADGLLAMATRESFSEQEPNPILSLLSYLRPPTGTFSQPPLRATWESKAAAFRTLAERRLPTEFALRLRWRQGHYQPVSAYLLLAEPGQILRQLEREANGPSTSIAVQALRVLAEYGGDEAGAILSRLAQSGRYSTEAKARLLEYERRRSEGRDEPPTGAQGSRTAKPMPTG